MSMSQHSAQQQQQQQQQDDDLDLQSEHHSDSPPPQPLLRPAQGAWSAYNFPQRRHPTTSSTAAATSSSRLTHPESAQRHSQGGSGFTRGSNLSEHSTTASTRRPSPGPSSRPYNANYYPNAAYTQQPTSTPSNNKNTSYYRSVSPASSRGRDSGHQIQQRNTVEERGDSHQHQQQQQRTHPQHHHQKSSSPTALSRENTRSPPGRFGPRNQRSTSPSSLTPSATPAATAVHNDTSISQIIAATQSGIPASSSSGPVVRDGAVGHISSSQAQPIQHSSSPVVNSRPSGPPESGHKSGFPRPKSTSNSSTTMYPFNPLPAAGMSDAGIPSHSNSNENAANSNIPDSNSPNAFTGDPATMTSSAVPDMTSPLLTTFPSMTEHHGHPQQQQQQQSHIPQTLTPSLTPSLPPVQTRPPPLPTQGHTHSQTLTPAITPTSSVPPPPSVQPQTHAALPQEIVVLLMEDIRFTGPEDPDFQLAEVSVSLREGSSSGSGEGPWWADGEEVIKALQMTTGRLEGAAKVYARRGKYRQCFVRVSEDGTMECQPSSLLMVSREKTIELIIEPNFESRPSHELYSYHRSHTPHHLPYQHPAAYSHQPLHLHSHSRSIPSRMGMNLNMTGASPSGSVNIGGISVPYDEYYGGPTPTHLHPQGQTYSVQMNHGQPPQSYYGGGGSTSPTFGQKRNHEDDSLANNANNNNNNKRSRTSGNHSGGNSSGGGGGGGLGGGGNGNGSANLGLGGMVGVEVGISSASGVPSSTSNPVSSGQTNSMNTHPDTLVEGAILGSSGPSGGGSSSNPGNASNSSSTKSRVGLGLGLSRPDSRGPGGPSSSSGGNNTGSSNNNSGGGGGGGGGGGNNSGLSTNPLSVSIVNVGVRPSAPLGLGNVAVGAPGRPRALTSSSGTGVGGPSASSPSGTATSHAQRPPSPEEYHSSTLLPPIASRMGNPTFVNHPGGKAPKEIVNAAIVAYLRSHIQTEEGYIEFAASKGRLLPIPELLKGYRFAARIVATWANRKTPPTAEGCGNKRITKNHVLQALFRQTSWGSDCEQTLQLADKYGPGGPFEDPRVIDILNGGSMLPEKGSLAFGGNNGAGGDGLSKTTPGRSQGSVALLDFLKDIDRDYKSRNGIVKKPPVAGGGGGGGGTPSGNGETNPPRRTALITGNPYPPAPTSLNTHNEDGPNNAALSTIIPTTAGSSASPPTQSLSPSATPAILPNSIHAADSTSADTGTNIGEVVDVSSSIITPASDTGPNANSIEPSMTGATVAGVIAASTPSMTPS